ncbi:hypothetical protein EG865_15455, partial [Enterococcus faecalis]
MCVAPVALDALRHEPRERAEGALAPVDHGLDDVEHHGVVGVAEGAAHRGHRGRGQPVPVHAELEAARVPKVHGAQGQR